MTLWRDLGRPGVSSDTKALQRRHKELFTSQGYGRPTISFEHDLFGKPTPTFPDHALTGAIAMSMQSVASPAHVISPPKASSLRHIPGDEGWPFIGRTLHILADPK